MRGEGEENGKKIHKEDKGRLGHREEKINHGFP